MTRRRGATAARASRSGGERRAAILRAAARIIAARGYDATRVEDVAVAVGVLKGSLYNHIDSKEDLLFGVMEAAYHGSRPLIERCERMDGDALVRLRAYVHAQVLHNIANRDEINVFLRDFRSLSPERAARILAYRDEHDRFLRRLIAAGIAEGTIAPQVDVKLTAFAILGMINWVPRWWSPDGALPPAAIAEEFASLVLGGIATRERRSAGRRDEGRERLEAREVVP